jgi:hypothetical protein
MHQKAEMYFCVIRRGAKVWTLEENNLNKDVHLGAPGTGDLFFIGPGVYRRLKKNGEVHLYASQSPNIFWNKFIGHQRCYGWTKRVQTARAEQRSSHKYTRH